MTSKLFKKNRKKILSQMKDDSIFVIFSKKEEETITSQRYNVNRNYYYVSGVLEFENIVVLTKINSIEKEYIYINPYDEFKAKWVGAPLSIEMVSSLSGIDNINYLSSFENDIEQLLSIVNNLYLDLNPVNPNGCISEVEAFSNKIKNKFPLIEVLNGKDLFKNARTVKDSEEIEEIKKAISITNEGLKAVMSNLGPKYEYQIESYFDQAIKYFGATGYAFPTIAASGRNATCLHYGNNNCMAKDGDLILLDLGASVNMYCSDITRTYPINGRFSPRQKELYNIVLKGQELILNTAKPGLTTKDLNNILVEYYAKELKRIGLIKEDKEVFKYYYHGVSHHMGLDCHDLCDYGPLKPGCVISNEPGLYIEEERIGIRIEDDILITENGAINLSKDIIRTVEDIEKFIEESRK